MLNNIQNHIFWIVLLPFIGFAINMFFGRFLAKGLVGFVACVSVFLAFLISAAVFFKLQAGNEAIAQVAYEWFSVGSFKASMGLRIDHLSAVMILVVTGVGFLIHLYSIGYMHDDPRYSRYFAYLNLFTGFMLCLVTADNLLLMFVGWEGVGLCSYLLIGFWFEKTPNAIAGMKAFIVNRIGDFGFTIGLFLLFAYLGVKTGVWTINFAQLQETLTTHKDLSTGILTAVGILLFVGACGKSAQIPLFVWLPDAMAGPTPVSALIHAATMVTAGVYMVARMNFLYVMAPVALTVVAVVGALTAIFAATIGLAQNDIKKVLAYSTVSQLGYMFMGVGVGAFAAGIFHLMTHAFFKACLFLGSGSVIHGTGGEQDIRKMGGLKKYMPITYITFFVACLAIAGIPPFAGFFSKDEILWKAYSTNMLAIAWAGKAIWLVGFVGAGMTAFYMFRLLFKTFYGEYNGAHTEEHSHKEHHSPHESPISMTLPLIILALLSIIGGFVGVGGHFERWLEPVFEGSKSEAGSATAEHILMVASVLVAALGILVAWAFYIKWEGLPGVVARKFKGAYELVLNKYWVDEIYQSLIINPLVLLNKLLGKFDNFVIDGAVNNTAAEAALTSNNAGLVDNFVVDGAVNKTGDLVLETGRNLRGIQTGRIRNYIATAVAGTLVIVLSYNLWFLRDKIINYIENIIR